LIKEELHMLDIKKNLEGSKLEFVLDGRLDTITAPQLEEEVKASIDGITELVFDFNNLAYVSSAGLRVLLSAQKTMNDKGTMVVRNVSDEIQEIFDVTGFSDILTIE
jgi:anti-sigma B factor antagonist